MPKSTIIGPLTIGLIVRGKTDENHKPGVMEQHADCILPNGAPIGFFGDGGDASSGSSAPSFASSLKSWANGPSVSWNNTGMNMKGMVADYDTLKKIRPMYVDSAMAKKYNLVSTVLLLDVTKPEADLFSQYWTNLGLNPGSFNILGGNCSTHASEAFVAAKIVTAGIPGLDTPDNLFRQLKAKHAGTTRVFSGHIGNRPVGGGRYELTFN